MRERITIRRSRYIVFPYYIGTRLQVLDSASCCRSFMRIKIDICNFLSAGILRPVSIRIQNGIGNVVEGDSTVARVQRRCYVKAAGFHCTGAGKYNRRRISILAVSNLQAGGT